MLQRFLQAAAKKWKSYKYRFVPWIAVNLGKTERPFRYVPKGSQDKLLSEEKITSSILKLFQALFVFDFSRQTDVFNLLPEEVKCQYRHLLTVSQNFQRNVYHKEGGCTLDPNEILYYTLRFSISRAPSTFRSAGIGVFVTRGFVPKGAVVSMYPGTVYQKYEPILFQSLGNPFIFRCIDGVLIDGNDKGISRAVYRSCSGRDRLGPCKMSDVTWLTSFPDNPLAVGQYVNNCSYDKPANVCYQEYDVPVTFPIELWQYFPNVNYRHDIQRPLRCVVLVALRDIGEGEELFSNYYTIVN
uniref:SET domain containing 9 n=2 Tax=Latimeria chalumnae TaxID=7897 RepID=H3AAK3_LATCH